jgi:hypothetical protein
MATPITFTVGNEQLTADPVKTSGRFWDTLKTWVGESSGAFDLMNSMKKICTLSGNDYLAGKAGGFVAGASVPRLFGASISLVQTCKKAHAEKVMTPHIAADLTHQGLDTLTTAAYASAFFAKTSQPFINAGTALGTVSDASDAAVFATEISDSQKRLQGAETAAPAIKTAIKNDITWSVLKLIKAVTAAVAGFFATYLILMGAPLVPVALALTISVASSLFSVSAYYFKNYYCEHFLKAEFKPKLA